MKIKLSSVMVDDQAKALAFYTDILGFVKRQDVPIGKDRWLTVSSKKNIEIELLLEPLGFPPAIEFQKALFEAGMPANAFSVDSIVEEYDRLKEAGVEFTTPPTRAGSVMIAVFNDTCGNLIQIYQE